METYKTKEVIEICDLKMERLKAWIDRGYITPSIQSSPGYGGRNLWSRLDLYTVALFKYMTDSGFSREVTDRFLSLGTLGGREIEDEGLGNIAYLVFMRKGDRVDGALISYRDHTDISLDVVSLTRDLNMKGFDDLYVINFQGLKQRIDRKIEEIKGSK